MGTTTINNDGGSVAQYNSSRLYIKSADCSSDFPNGDFMRGRGSGTPSHIPRVGPERRDTVIFINA